MTTPTPTDLPESLDRSAAVNLACNMLNQHGCKGITPQGVRVLSEAVIAMDAALSAAAPAVAPVIPALDGLPEWGELSERAEPVAWMDPATSDVIHAERKNAWLESFGIGGKSKAATYTTPLYAAPQAQQPTAHQAGAESYPPSMNRQQITDRFGFLEGVVNEANYQRITDEAFAIYSAALRARGAVPMPPSYESSTLSTRRPPGTGCRVAFHFGNTEEAERWMDGVLSAPAAPMSAQHGAVAEIVSVVGAGPNDVGIRWRGGIASVGALLYSAPAAVSAPSVPEGWKLVPVQPTETMVMAGYDAYGVHECYAAMLAAAPQPPAALPGEQDARDAARYRWLRDVSVPPHNFYLSVPDEFKDERYTRAEVDAAIDAAMLAAAPQAPAGEGGGA